MSEEVSETEMKPVVEGVLCGLEVLEHRYSIN